MQSSRNFIAAAAKLTSSVEEFNIHISDADSPLRMGIVPRPSSVTVTEPSAWGLLLHGALPKPHQQVLLPRKLDGGVHSRASRADVHSSRFELVPDLPELESDRRCNPLYF